ncbi:pilus assembly protein PilM [Bacillus sp. FJAT-42376]|uniref:type IV pilus biogenesis protein PilM n=1 Tax=Bacillus sp. FJAT-42376 TaxID=2014076 RepID=UPI000F4DFFCF|nr:pilus assembly protein PilM [Bacillus sp. FJAT-42376]AZB43808.1 pilus assembly protein PilM [Bacillus sp. FJAT-42376]
MKLSLFRPRASVANLLFTDYSIQYLELKSLDPLEISGFGEHFLPEGIISNGRIQDYDKLSLILEECKQEWSLKRKKIRFIVPDSFVVVKKIEVPDDILEDEMKGYLYTELGNSIHLPFEDPIFDVQIIDRSGKSRDVYLFAAPEAAVQDYVRFLDQHRLLAAVADISPLCLFRLHNKLQGNKPGLVSSLLIQTNMKSVTFSIFKQDELLMMRSLPIAVQIKDWDCQYLSASGEYFKLTHKTQTNEEVLSVFEDSLREIERVMNFYQYTLNEGKRKIDRVFLAGDHPLMKELSEKITAAAGMPVASILKESIYTLSNEALPGKFDVLLGLALKEVE